MTKERMLAALEDLGKKLDAKGLKGKIVMAGGASMCLVHGARPQTHDIDALYGQKDELEAAAAEIAETRGWPLDWLNDGIAGFLTFEPPVDFFMDLPGLTVYTVAPECLLAMKLSAARLTENFGKDIDDAHFLGRLMGYTSPEQFLETYGKFFKDEPLSDDGHFIIDSFFEAPSEILE